MRLPKIATLVVVLTLSLAAVAQAGQRYASPGGSPGEACTQASPCVLQQAVSEAQQNDEVIVTSGTYNVGSGLAMPQKNLTIRGDFGGSRPLLIANSFQPALSIKDGRVEYLELINTDPTESIGISCLGTVVRRVEVASSGYESTGISSGSCIVTDSVVTVSGTVSTGLMAFPYGETPTYARNLTVISTGAESTGIGGVNYTSTPNFNVLDLANSIAIGGKYDLRATDPGGPGTARVTVSNSNFETTSTATKSTIVDRGGNQTAAPVFADFAKSDFHQAAGSPTIDAGAADVYVGTEDFDGSARPSGTVPDIGAFEFAKPTTAPPPPAAGRLLSLSLSPKTFAAAKSGGAILSAKNGKGKPPATGATVSYSLSAAGTATFTVEQILNGRKAGKRCVKQSKSNKAKKKCALRKPVNGSFSHNGAAGANHFKLTGRIGAKALKPGRYELIGTAGGTTLRTPFKIVK